MDVKPRFGMQYTHTLPNWWSKIHWMYQGDIPGSTISSMQWKDLGNGSLLIMEGNTQRFWKHQVPKSKRIAEPRLNLTFRKICRAPAHGPG